MTLITEGSLPTLTIDPAALSEAASAMTQAVSEVEQTGLDIVTSWAGLGAAYDAPEASDLQFKMQIVETSATDFGGSFSRAGSILTTLAESLAGAKTRLENLRVEVGQLEQSVTRYRGDVAADVESDGPVDRMWGPGQYLWNVELLGERDAIQRTIDQAIEEAASDLRTINEPFGLDGLSGPPPLAVPVSSAERQTRFTDDLALTVLGKLSLVDQAAIEQLLAANPEWAALLRDHPPTAEVVNGWWTGLNNEATWTALILGAPTIIGSLGGIPPLARVAANRENAVHRLAYINARIDKLSGITPGGGFSTPRMDFSEDVAKLRAERGYLERGAISGHVQLYLYRPENDSVIEMIGTPGATTTMMTTYVPGTYTSVHSFYDGSAQQVPRWLNQSDPNAVAFVWKVGDFPGEDPLSGDANLFRIFEANDVPRTLQTGAFLSNFQNEVHASSPVLTGAQQVGIGHSWGLAAITSSEVAGAHYDQVHSLAGAGMPEDWKPQDGTTYNHWAYTDILTMAQSTGAVWDGKIPANEPAFASHIYERDGDFTVYLPTQTAPGGMVVSPTPPASIQASWNAMDNHNLIASSRTENQAALEDIRESTKK